MGISVRKSVESDIDTIADFQLRLAKETENLSLDLTTLKKGIRAMFDDPRLGRYFIAEVDGQLVGCHSITYEWSDWRNGVVWWIQSVYVIETQRKNGIFKAMFNNLQKLMSQESQVVGLRLYVDKTNIRAQHVYSSLGMNGEHYSVYELMK